MAVLCTLDLSPDSRRWIEKPFRGLGRGAATAWQQI